MRASTLAFVIVSGAAAMAMAPRRKRRTLKDKVVVITGGSRGLGLALAREFCAAGSKVVIAARDAAELDRAVQSIRERRNRDLHCQITPVRCDVTDRTNVLSALRLIERTVGPIDILVNNAGIITVAPLENLQVEHIEEAMNTNFYGAVNTCFAALPSMLERAKGAIVNVASIGGIVAVPHLSPYTASKFALVGFSRGLHAELRPKGIDVLTVCPWLMRTGSNIQAKFGGKKQAEFGWFSLGATLPLVSVAPEQAAHQIVDAIRYGKAELLIGSFAVGTAKLAALFPKATSTALSIMARILPGPIRGGDGGQVRGKEVDGSPSIALRALGTTASRRFNQT